MSWYQDRMDASAFGWHMSRYDGEGGTYYGLRNAESMKAVAEYRRLHLQAPSSYQAAEGCGSP